MASWQKRLSPWLHGLRRIVIIEIVIMAACGLIALLAGIRSTNAFSLLVLGVGVVIFSIGPFSLMGGWGTTRSWNYQYLRTMEDNTTLHRIAQDKNEIRQSIGLLIPSMVIGSITIVISVFISNL